MSDVLDQVTELLRVRIAEIDKEAAQLQRTLAGLGGDSNSTPRKASGQPKRRRATKRAKKGQRLAEVSAILKSNPKSKTSEIAKQIGISSNQVSALRTQLTKKAPKAQKKQPTKKPPRKNRKLPSL